MNGAKRKKKIGMNETPCFCNTCLGEMKFYPYVNSINKLLNAKMIILKNRIYCHNNSDF